MHCPCTLLVTIPLSCSAILAYLSFLMFFSKMCVCRWVCGLSLPLTGKSAYSGPFQTLWLADGASPTGAHGPECQARQGCLEEDVSPPLITSFSSFWVPDGAPAVRQLKRASEKRVFLDAERTDGGLETELKVSRVRNGRML